MASTTPFRSAGSRSRYSETENDDDDGIGEVEDGRTEGERNGAGSRRREEDGAEEEIDPDLLLFHKQVNIKDSGTSNDAGPQASSSPPRPPSASRGGTPIGSAAISSGRKGKRGEKKSVHQQPQHQHQTLQQQAQQAQQQQVEEPRATGGLLNRERMEWLTTQHLDLTSARSNAPSVQPHCAAFHHTQALFAAAVGRSIIEYDILTGCKLSSLDIGAPVVQMAYSPSGGHIIVAVLEDLTIRSWDLDTEHTYVLYTPGERKSSKAAGSSVEVHIALTPLRPWLFFGAHHRMSVNVVGTIEGVRAATRIKADVKKPITDLACHPRSPLLYVAYADGVVRAYNIQNFSVQYTLQVEPTIKLVGASAFAFHSEFDWVFIGDRSGTLLAWDVSVPNRPTIIGITQVGMNPVAALQWHSMLQLLLTLSKDGSVQAWKPRANLNPNRHPLRANFFLPAAIEPLDVGSILTQFGGVPVYPVPRIVNLLVHPKLNLATVLFASVAGGDEESRKKTPVVSREARKQLFAVLQSTRGSPVSVLKEKLSALGSAGILHGHQLLQQARTQAGGTQLTMSDLARKAFLYGNSNLEQVKSGPILTLPMLTIANYNHLLQDIPVCQPLHQNLMFFNSEQRIFNYSTRIFFMDACDLISYNLTSAEYNVYKKLSATAADGNERTPTHMIHSTKHHLFLVFFMCRGSNSSEVDLYKDPHGLNTRSERTNTVSGCDGAFIGRHESQYAILEDDAVGLTLDFLGEPPDLLTMSGEPGVNGNKKANDVPDAISFEDPGTNVLGANGDAAKSTAKANPPRPREPLQFTFDNPVQRIFSCPLESTILYVVADSHLGLAKVSSDAYATVGGHLTLSTKPEAGKFVKLNDTERVLQVRWQETLSGYVAGIMTTQRVLIASANLEILSSTSTIVDKGFPPFRSILWAGPALLFSTSTSVAVLGWDGVARPVATTGSPNSALLGVLNDRLLLATANESNNKHRYLVDVKSRLVGLLEPLLIGWTTLQKCFEPKLDLTEIMYQLTSRFDNLRVTPRSLDVLSTGPPICGDLAVELAQSGPQFTQELRCKYAIRVRRFGTALGILKDEYLRSRDYPKCPQTTRLFQRFRELGQACVKYGQFDTAKETFEVVSDFESMLDLFICHRNPSAMRRLIIKLDEGKTFPELRRYADKILSLRSAGWSQGASWKAESMAPKGIEWGGGNWHIQTSPETKGVPRWELSSEVTAYMKTLNGPIPTLIPDHIGVYLGTVKGRGSVVEIRDTSHTRKFSSGVSDESNGLETVAGVLGKSASNKSKTSDDGTKVERGKGAAHQGTVVGQEMDVDLQAKAEEEFKKGMYGPDKSSSDEEDEATKNKRRILVRIREKPGGSGSLVDVDKVKEATKKFQLGDSMRGPRTQRPVSTLLEPIPGSIKIPGREPSGLPPIAAVPLGMNAQPPSFNAPPSNLTGPPMVRMGVGVGSGPIPEEIFQGEATITQSNPNLQPVHPAQPYPGQWSSFGGAGAPGAPPEGFYPFPSGLRQPSGPSVPPGQRPQFQDLPPTGPPGSIPPGGFPPQSATEFAAAEFSLPDGGVPPKAPPVPPGAAPSRATTTVPAVASRKNEVPAQAQTGLSALADLEKEPQPPSPKGPPKPGQVPRGAPASVCFKIGLAHVEENQLTDAMQCFNEAFLAMAKDQSLGVNVKPQARICAQYKIAVLLLQEVARLQRVEGQGAVGAKEEMARLSRHLASLPLQAKHRILCIRTSIRRNMDVQNYAYSKKMLDMLISKAPKNKQEELLGLVKVCVQRGLTDRIIDGDEDASQFCAATMGRLPTIGHDSCDTCGAKFSALSSPGCVVCGMGTVRRSDEATGPSATPFS